MARFCPQCGLSVNPLVNFCNRCGKHLRPRSQPPGPAPSAAGGSVETLPTWSGWQPDPAAPAALDSEGASQSPSPPPAVGAVAPPQTWESYDYPSEGSSEGSPPGPQAGWTGSPSQAWSGQELRPPSDASRPLPPLAEVMGTNMDSARERAREITLNFSLWAAGIVLFPVPFSDLVLLMPVQSAMVIAIGRAYGVKDPPEKVLAILAGACGASVFGQITTLFVANLIPIIGKFVSAPFVFGWTYGLGEVAMRYFETQGEASSDELRQIFKKASRQATRKFDSERKIGPREALDQVKGFLSEDEYRKIRERFGQGQP